MTALRSIASDTLRALAILACALLALHVRPAAAQSGPAAARDPEVTIAIPGNLFASTDEDRPVGLFIEVVDAVFRDQGLAPKYVTMPTGDALRAVGAGTLAAATVVVPNPELRQRVHLSVPVVVEHNVAVTVRGRGFAIRRLADLRGKRVGVRQGYRYPLLETDPGIAMLRHRTDGEMIRCLIFETCDLVVISGISDLHEFRAEEIMSRLEVMDTALGSVPLVMALSTDRFTAEDAARFDRAIEAFQASTRWRELVTRRGLADLVRDWPLVAR